MKKLKNYRVLLVQFVMLLISYVYFSWISPLIPFDADDWLFSGTLRVPFPIWGAFNPTRALPEVLYPVGLPNIR